MTQSTLSRPVPARGVRSRRRAPSAADQVVVGMDLGDLKSNWCRLGAVEERAKEGVVATDRESLSQLFGELPPGSLVVMEVSTQSPWISRLVEEHGHEPLVADPRRLKAITESDRKNDRRDAQVLARLARADRGLLNPVRHRSEQQQADLSVVNARGCLVKARTMLVNQVRGLVKPLGYRIPRCSAASIARKAKEYVPEKLAAAIAPLLKSIASLSDQIKCLDKQIQKVCEERYPETGVMRQVAGVGYLTSLRFALVVQSPDRIRRNRQVGPLLGLVPRQAQSCGYDPQLGISKAGDRDLRRLLVISANFILREASPDSDLKRLGSRISERGGKNARRRAKVAVARRLAVLMLHLWRTGEEYDPLHNAKKLEAQQAMS